MHFMNNYNVLYTFLTLHNAYFFKDNRSNYENAYTDVLKGLLHPKMKILSFITYPHVVPNL